MLCCAIGMRLQWRLPARIARCLAVAVWVMIGLPCGSLLAQTDLLNLPETEFRGPVPEPNLPGGNTTVVPRQQVPDGGENDGTGLVQLEAMVTENGGTIQEDLIWRIFGVTPNKAGKPQLILTRTAANPLVKLKSGDYYVHASFGQAYVNRRITIVAGSRSLERFVLNAGGLVVIPVVTSATPVSDSDLQFDIYSDDRDQQDNQTKVVGGARPGVLVRLNSGIYRIESRYGKANAVVQASVTVEPGKRTEVQVKHEAGRASFRLTTRKGGEAMAATNWSVLAPDGLVVVKSAGALPTHVLAPGAYSVVATADGRSFRRDFTIANGQNIVVELLFE